MESIHVALRVRPLNSRELAKSQQTAWVVQNNSITQLSMTTRKPIPGDYASYSFDRVYDVDSQTGTIYDQMAAKIVRSSLDGFNGTIFAYGQTSSGKTFTMHGSADTPGIIALAVRDIFARIAASTNREFLVRVGYMEIYNEVVKDLLNPSSGSLKIHEDLDRGVFVGELKEEVVVTHEEVLALMAQGEANRHVGATNMNERSSRSHTIFQMTIESRCRADGVVRVSRLNLVDLAGSERTCQTGAEGQRLREGGHINRSLLTLGTVIARLSAVSGADGGQAVAQHIPYRDSKLTRILQPALGGNSLTAVIATITPAAMHIEESHSTLKFASRATRIKNTAHVNEVVVDDAALLDRYKKEIEVLREQIALTQSEKSETTQKLLALERFLHIQQPAQIPVLESKKARKQRRTTLNPAVLSKPNKENHLHSGEPTITSSESATSVHEVIASKLRDSRQWKEIVNEKSMQVAQLKSNVEMLEADNEELLEKWLSVKSTFPRLLNSLLDGQGSVVETVLSSLHDLDDRLQGALASMAALQKNVTRPLLVQEDVIQFSVNCVQDIKLSINVVDDAETQCLESKISALESTNRFLSGQLSTVECENRLLKDQLDNYIQRSTDLERVIVGQYALQSTIAELEATNRVISSQLAVANEEIHRLSAVNGGMSEFEDQLTAYKARIAELDVINEQLRSRDEETRGAMCHLRQNIELSNQRTSALESVVGKASDELALLRCQKADLEEKLAALEAERSAGLLDKPQAPMDMSQMDQEERQVELDVLQSELALRIRDFEESKTTQALQKAEMDGLLQQLSVARRLISELEASKVTEDSKMDALQSQLEDANTAIGTLQDEFDAETGSLQKEIITLKAALEMAETRCTSLQNQMQDLVAEQEETDAKFEAAYEDVSKQLAEAEEILKLKEDELLKMRRENGLLQGNLEAAQRKSAELAQSSDQLTSLQQELSTSRSFEEKYLELLTANSNLEELIKSLQDCLSERDAAIRSLQEELSVAEEQAQKNESAQAAAPALGSSGPIRSFLDDTSAASKLSVQQIQAQLNQKSRDCDRLKAELDKIKLDHDKLKVEHEQLKKDSRQTNNLVKECVTLNEKIKSLDQKLKEVTDAKRSLMVERDELQRRTIDLQKKNDLFKEQNDKLRVQDTNKKELVAKVNRLEKLETVKEQYEELVQQHAATSAECETIKADCMLKDEMIREMHCQLQSCTAKIGDLEDEISSLKCEITDKEAHWKQSSESAAEIFASDKADWEHRAANAQALIDQLRSNVSSLEVDKDGLLSALNCMEGDLFEYKAQLQVASAQNAELNERKIPSLIRCCEKAEALAANVQHEKEMLAAELTDMAMQLESVGSELLTVRQAFAQLEDECASLKTTNATLVKTVSDGERLYKEAKAELAVASREFSEQIEDLTRDITKLSNDLSEAHHTIASLESQVDAEKEKSIHLQSEFNRLNEYAQSTQKKLKIEEGKHKNTRIEMESMQDKLDELHKQASLVKDLQFEVQSLRADKETLEDMLDAMKRAKDDLLTKLKNNADRNDACSKCAQMVVENSELQKQLNQLLSDQVTAESELFDMDEQLKQERSKSEDYARKLAEFYRKEKAHTNAQSTSSAQMPVISVFQDSSAAAVDKENGPSLAPSTPGRKAVLGPRVGLSAVALSAATSIPVFEDKENGPRSAGQKLAPTASDIRTRLSMMRVGTSPLVKK